ncbi:Ni/Fe hydrogenase subunit alpha [Geoalkalibacter halelectricus]|uniref:Ni/Fe hydrogenase subunit alpha n=2 Tax=Geoalkalibacter halelectricus TaxID=2847045 RepID=A0ABY5ZL58_9BACT|nr:Ni/Fe hydrogenase subunit alpha [Geoalkalibacter halelectricus]MDO3377756.1 Ni/Fe hydrogenase subunit alpha [Geoalkalibacter halelectricus]UWZ78650.1 Ni/Fe hydrogenase subunit alpha [Geoalkalibacter halelectricus]
MNIDIKHLARMEGHANLVVDTANGELKECRLEIVESPRFFEVMLKGRHYSDVAPIAARICGVCSVSHTLASLAATENALGVKVSAQTLGLRRLLSYGENLQSHLLHLYFMAVPDYLGVPSLLPLVKTRRKLVARALRLKKVANDLVRIVGGRPVHPVTPRVGGFSALPAAQDLKELRRRLVAALADLEETVAMFASFAVPEMARETEYLCLDAAEGYPSLAARMVSSDGIDAPVAEFPAIVQEYFKPYANAKFARASRDTLMVGPLARYRNAAAKLSPMAKKVAAALSLDPATTNPYHGNLARLTEVVHFFEEAIHLIDSLLLKGIRSESIWVPPGGGTGAGAVEAPRGTLFHAYAYDEQGRITAANCIIPTAQNLGNIEADLRALVPEILHLPKEEITTRLEMLIRAYDPCISCSTHLVKVEYL